MNPFLVAVLFGGTTYLTMEACRDRSVPLPAKRLRAEVLRAALCGCVSIAGGILATHDAQPATFVAVLVLCLGLGATCYLAMFGSVSPIIPATALIVVVGAAVISSDFGPLISAVAVGLPFALTTFLGPDTKASYRDTLVAALGGAVFGIAAGAIVVAGVCFVTLLARAARKGGMAGVRPGFAQALSGGLLAALVGQLAIS